MDRPFREVHELYKILYQRAEAQQKEAEEREKKEKEEEKRQNKKGPTSRRQPTDEASAIPTPSPLEMEALEEMFEDMM